MAVITLPSTPGPASAAPTLIDFGVTLRPATGAPADHYQRAGSRWQLSVAFPPMKPDTARVFVSRIAEAKAESLRIPFPLMGLSQGSPGTAVQVNGSGAAGTSLPLKGLPVGYVLKEGYWLTAIDASGVYCLHNVRADATANGSGQLTATVYPPLRRPLVNNDSVLVQVPMIEGLVTSDHAWPLPQDRLVRLEVTIEERA